MASMRLVDQLCPDNLLRTFKGGLAAADIALCAACMGLLIQELPVGQARAEPPPPAGSEKPAKKGAAASTTPKAAAKPTATPERKAAGARADSPARRAGSAERASGGGSDAPAEAPDPAKSIAGTAALEKDIKDIVEVLKSFVCRVMASSSADDK